MHVWICGAGILIDIILNFFYHEGVLNCHLLITHPRGVFYWVFIQLKLEYEYISPSSVGCAQKWPKTPFITPLVTASGISQETAYPSVRLVRPTYFFSRFISYKFMFTTPSPWAIFHRCIRRTPYLSVWMKTLTIHNSTQLSRHHLDIIHFSHLFVLPYRMISWWGRWLWRRTSRCRPTWGCRSPCLRRTRRNAWSTSWGSWDSNTAPTHGWVRVFLSSWP